jgi:hypothetical protein
VRIDELLPHWDFAEHHRHPTTAPAARLLAAATAVTWAEVPVMRQLMWVRSAGRLSLPGRSTILEGMYGIGFTELDRTADELVAGGIGRPWSPRGGHPSQPTDFTGYAEPGWAKIIFNFHAGAGELTTQTRVQLTNAASRRAFRAYWLVIRPFSGLIRRQWLAAIVRRAEHL